MAKLLKKQKLSTESFLFKFSKPAGCEPKPGQFVALELKPGGEKISSLIADYDKKSFSIITPAASYEAEALLQLKKNGEIPIFGPIGRPLEIKEYGNVCFICEGTGLGPFYLLSRAFKKAGNKVIIIASFQNRKEKFWEKRLAKACDKLITIIDKKNNITHGVVTELHNLMRRKHFGFVLANCDPNVMREIARITNQRAKTYVLLTPKIRDGVGMCGACRITYKNEVRFACIDGPAFNAHKLDWNDVLNKHKIWRGV